MKKDAFDEHDESETDYVTGANLLGRDITRSENLNFSFFFSSGFNKKCSIRVWPIFDRERLFASKTGSLTLSGDWKFKPGKNDATVPREDIEKMKLFFKQCFVLFSMAWDEQIPENTIQDYLKGNINLDELIKDTDFFDIIVKQDLDRIKSIEDFANYCKGNGLVRFYNN